MTSSLRRAPNDRPFVALFRTFFEQLFTSEWVTSDDQLRTAIVGVLAFVLTPGVVLLLEVFPEYQSAVIRAKVLHAPAGLIDDLLEWIVLTLVTYSMVAVGLVTTAVWDALTFDRRDAMVLGPLPVPGRTIVLAKLAALTAFLLGACLVVNLLNAVVFAVETTDQFGAKALVLHFAAFAVATTGAAVVVFAAIVGIRGALAMFGGERLAAVLGSLLQFGFVVALLWSVVLTPFVLLSHPPRYVTTVVTRTFTDAMPSTWFVGLFEMMRQSPRRFRPEFVMLARRGMSAFFVAVICAVLASIGAFRRQAQLALAQSARPGTAGAARLSRAVARALVFRDWTACGISEFILMTIARNRGQQAPIALNAGVGLAMIAFGITRSRAEVMPVLLSVPLIVAYWMVVGMRASFFLPSELPAAWLFNINPNNARSYSTGVLASVLGFVGPPAVFLGAIVGAIDDGIAGGVRHATVVLLVVWLLAEVVAITVDFVPFTRPYRPAHAKLKTRWPLYLLGAYAFGSAVVQLELVLREGNSWWLMAASGVVGIAIADVARRYQAVRRSAACEPDSSHDEGRIAVLDISGIDQYARNQPTDA